MHYMLVNLLHSHYMQHVMYVITYPLHAFEDANAELVARGDNNNVVVSMLDCMHFSSVNCFSCLISENQLVSTLL